MLRIQRLACPCGSMKRGHRLECATSTALSVDSASRGSPSTCGQRRAGLEPGRSKDGEHQSQEHGVDADLPQTHGHGVAQGGDGAAARVVRHARGLERSLPALQQLAPVAVREDREVGHRACNSQAAD